MIQKEFDSIETFRCAKESKDRRKNSKAPSWFGKGKGSLPAGRFNTIVVRPIIKGNGIFRERADGEIWLTDDPLRRVVQIRSRFPFGRVTLRLVRIEREDDAAPATIREAR